MLVSSLLATGRQSGRAALSQHHKHRTAGHDAAFERAQQAEADGKKVVGRRAASDDPELEAVRRQGPLAYYDFLAGVKEIRLDQHQRAALRPLQTLHDALLALESAAAVAPTGFGRLRALFGGTTPDSGNPVCRLPVAQRPRGLYMYGDVGCGKTFLMDMFYECCPVRAKQRVHFHAFMLDVHRRVHRWRSARHGSHDNDPIPPLVADLAAEARVLCFDEFQVTDVADAMILHRIFRGLIDEHGVVAVSTSNRPPSDLYKNGLNRAAFLPFIDFLQQRCVVHNLNSGVDYRLSSAAGSDASVYRTPVGPDADADMDRLFAELTHHQPVAPRHVKIKGLARQLFVPRAARGVARFTFAELCAQPLSAADYLALAGHFHTVIVDRIPVMTLNEKVEARRFITLVDALYEHKVKLLCSAAAPPHALFVAATTAASQDAIASYASSEEEVFAFSRAVSRIIEMQSREYLEAAHIKAP